MSSNQKQTAAGGPQTQRFTSSPYSVIEMVSRYITNGTVKQEGLCLLPQPHYRMLPPPQRPDGYPVSTPPGTYVQAPPNQGGNQAPNLRGPAGPPNQSSTPPNAADIKVPPIPQQASINMFTPGRPATTYYARTAVPPSQPPRMTNHNSRPQQPALFTQPQFMHVTAAAPPQMYLSTSSNPYTYNQRPTNFGPPVPIYSPHLAAYPYGTTPTQTQSVPYNYYASHMIQRTGSIPQAPPVNPNTTQNTVPNVTLGTNNPHQAFQRQQPPKRRPKALSIIDPDTGADRLQEMFEDNSHPPSGESSARQTPQPSAATSSHNKEVQATFMKLVRDQANDNPEEHHPTQQQQQPQSQQQLSQDDHHSDVQSDSTSTGSHHQANHVSDQSYAGHQVQQQQQLPQQMNREQIVKSSKLQAGAKEFTLPLAAKETPIVSANIDAVEVTLPNKLPKDRESPAKGRKQRIGDQKESIKEVAAVTNPTTANSDNKEASVVKDEVKAAPHEIKPTVAANVSTNSQVPPPVVVSSKEVVQTPKESVSTTSSTTAPIVDKQIRGYQQQQQQQQYRKDSKEPVVKSGLERQDSGSGSAPVVAHDSKSKQNAQRSASKQSSGGTNNQKSSGGGNPAPVPQPQPSKPASKSNKKNELNLKGANKEGTDMDAFNDNAIREEVNSNVITTQVVNNSDIINANSIPSVNNAANIKTESDQKTETNNKKIENLTIKASEPISKSKHKVDVTDIVKDKPKNIKPYSSMMGHDETDRVSSMQQSNEKMVQAKNDVNAKTSEINRVESEIPYSDGQWTPSNPNGFKVYKKDFLLFMKDSPASRKAPDNIPDAVLADEKGRLSDGRLSMGGGRTDFNPSFNTFSRNSSQKGPITGRSSASKMDRNKGGKGSSTVKQGMKVSISVREEVKLHEAENAWRPARFSKGEFATEEDKKTEELYRKVRGILNKLTPQKFDTLLQQIRSLQIDNVQRLQGVIDLVFEKAIDEPNFSVAYASMCGQLAQLQVPTSTNPEEKQDIVNFRKLLINKCQNEFEKQSIDENIRNQKLKEIEECTDVEKKKDLEFEFEEYCRRERMKSVGNTRFIGELFKQHMLTQNIMIRCLTNLLENKDEESLECLCKLLTTIGKELELKQVDLSGIFNQMKVLAENKQGIKISSRIRFMLQDVIDLRNSKWVPRRQDLNPKMIDQIQKEAEQEQMNIQIMNSIPTPRKEERSGGGGGGGSQSSMKGGRNKNVTDDGWIMKGSNKTPFTVQTDKLKGGRAPMADERLGAASQFKWFNNSNTNTKPTPQPITNTTNAFAVLDMENDRRSNSRLGQKDSYHSKGTSLERSNYKYDSRSGSRSGSQNRSNESSASSSQRGTPAPSSLPPQQTPQRIPQSASVSSTPIQVENLDEDQRFRRITNSLDEYVSGNCSLEEYFTDISCAVPASLFAKMVNDSFLYVIEKKQQVRLKTGSLFAKLIVQAKLPLDAYCAGLEEILSQADDLTIDIPKIWDYLAELLVDSITEEALPLKRLQQVMDILIQQQQAGKLLAPLFKLVISNKGTNFLKNQWRLSHLQFSDFMDSSQVDAFIRDNQFEFLLGGATPLGINQLGYDELYPKLLSFLRNNKGSIDEIMDWVTANIGDEGIKDTKFIRALATAIFEDSINKNYKLDSARLEKHSNLLHKYVDNNAKFELECLYALQALINKMEHPQGLLLNIFNKLYELGTFSQESFIAWEQSKDPAEQEGKGVALKQLTSFITQLKENLDDESSGSDIEE